MNIISVSLSIIVIFYQIYNSNGLFGASEVAKGKFPYVTKIYYYFGDRIHRLPQLFRRIYKNPCTGTIINEYFVITSAGCFQHLIDFKRKPDKTELNIDLHDQWDKLYLRAGIIPGKGRWAPGFQELRAKKVMIHPTFQNRSTMFDVDIALIKMDSPWNFAKDPSQVAPAPKWGKRIPELDWRMCYIVGYGFTTWWEYDNDMFYISCKYEIEWDYDFPERPEGNILRYYRTRVGRERYCKFLRKNLGFVGGVKGEIFDDFYMCGLPMNKTVRQGPCYGDMGSPLICNGIVTGVLSQFRSKFPLCDRRSTNNPAFEVFTSVGSEEVMTFLRKHIPEKDFPEFVDIPPGNPHDDYYEKDEYDYEEWTPAPWRP